MKFSAEWRATIREEILTRNLSLETLLEEHPEVDHWTLRTFFSEVRRDSLRESVERGMSTPLEPQRLPKRALDAVQAGWLRPIELQFESLPPQEPRFFSEGRKWIVLSDVHAPDQDDAALDVLFQIGRDLDPYGVIIDGDFFDCTSLSRFTPTAEQPLRWKDEQAEALKVAVRLNQNFPEQRKVFVPGNHDVRPRNWINANAIALQGYFTLEEWLGIQDLGWEVHDTFELAEGSLLVKHGTAVSQHAGYSVKREIEREGVSVIMGHVHRRAIIEMTKRDYELTGVELGCLCNLHPQYAPSENTSNWQHGFAVVTEHEGGEFDIEPVRISRGVAHFRGVRYESRV